MSLRTAFLWALIGSLVIGAALSIAALIVPGWSGRIGEIIGTALIIAAFSLIALDCSIVIGRRVLVPVMWIGLGSAMGAASLWIYLIWFGAWDVWGMPERLAVQLTVIAVWATVIGGLLVRAVVNRAVQHMRWSAVAFISLAAILTSTVAGLDLDAWWIFDLYITLAIVLATHLWPAALLRVPLNRPVGRVVRLATLTVTISLAAYLVFGVWAFVDLADYWPARVVSVLSILTV